MYIDDLSLIISTKDFRRLHDKTQLFSVEQNDHYRSRITHTIEVNTIAQLIADNISSTCPQQIDRMLVQAIAMGHDIGHTPFGHVGERTLGKILGGDDDLGGSIATDVLKQEKEPHYFKHNVNSYRVLTRKDLLIGQKKKSKIKPQISWQVLDGVLKHTEVYKQEHVKKISDPYNLHRSLLCSDLATRGTVAIHFTAAHPYYQHNIPLTVEGQIVAIADEIAQRVSDFDDCVRFGIENLSLDLAKKVSEPNVKQLLESMYAGRTNKNSINLYALSETICVELRKILISHVIFDATQYAPNDGLLMNQCIKFDDVGENINNVFEQATIKVIKGQISSIDQQNAQLIRELFAYYHDNLNKISERQFNYMFDDLETVIRKKFHSQTNGLKLSVSLNKEMPESREQKVKFVQAIVSIAKQAPLQENYVTSNKVLQAFKMCKDTEYFAKIYSTILDNIAYYIAGMTDGFARREYQKLQLSK